MLNWSDRDAKIHIAAICATLELESIFNTKYVYLWSYLYQIFRA